MCVWDFRGGSGGKTGKKPLACPSRKPSWISLRLIWLLRSGNMTDRIVRDSTEHFRDW